MSKLLSQTLLKLLLGSSLIFPVFFSSCRNRSTLNQFNDYTPTNNARRVIILGTNDIHGSIFPTFESDSQGTGGLSTWDATVRAIKLGTASDSAVILVDAGDQLQGTLESNFSEGERMLEALDRLGKVGDADPRFGYDGLIPGNHDYDFGPVGWLKDVADEEATDFDREVKIIDRIRKANTAEPTFKIKTLSPQREQMLRGSLIKAALKYRHPMLSANTYRTDSLIDDQGKPVIVDSQECKPVRAAQKIDWAQALRPNHVTSHRIIDAGGVKIALIGMDHVDTAANTIDVNVRDLCFRDIVSTYSATLAAIGDRADVYVMIIHDSAKNLAGGLAKNVKEISEKFPGKLHAVIAGHTHSTDKVMIGQIPLLQSGMGLKAYGRIDLEIDRTSTPIGVSPVLVESGIKILNHKCDTAIGFCKVVDGDVEIEGQKLQKSDWLDRHILETRAAVNNDFQLRGLSTTKVLAKSGSDFQRDFRRDSSMSRVLTDYIRTTYQSDIVILNSGGIRSDFPDGSSTNQPSIKYEDLFKVLPFSTELVLVERISAETLVDTFKEAVKGLNSYGVLVQSGLKIETKRDGSSFKLNKLTFIDEGTTTVIFDDAIGSSSIPNRFFKLITSDFLMRAKSGAMYLRDLDSRPLGVARELISMSLSNKCDAGSCFQFVDSGSGRGP